MKIAALSFFSAVDVPPGRTSRAQSSANQYDYKRQGDRRRKARVCEAARISPSSRLTTGLARQVIAQIDDSNSAAQSKARIEAARAAYHPMLSAIGAVISFRA
jgi:hypothetical protein